ncbi:MULTISPECIES: SDR family oxidoreductase [Clostridium]|uniref:Aldehyde reductase n=3 Tax=Clostridium TaxID=1485 RepID=A0A3M0SMB1_9CLOT|nr:MULTISPECIES: aldehyde reductase [Clostridium]ADK15055.1 putative Nucleoside-diphosphate-sugar epimerase, WcaG [Clostridium ljungdahlii DSM 13528]AGY74308.1 aldehyde reductase [Clostridium autoethanogenum DSM 10061]ALU34499.1 NAD-dependent epimerase/dehydratase [Clostridium autoethanogenum DSM 10061]OAA87716.1 UDP-glucose 4-epimerase [Clostridium ljungdahlii DSM 13528]OVY51219.1 UDP-glucose 4-epimerase [Clostridium autoethanogenum]
MQKNVLVTGGTGFLGVQIILQLLEKGYSVITTLRSISSKNKVIDTLKANGIKTFDNLTFVEADLLKDDNWDKAMEGCDYVLSVASPIFSDISQKDETEMMRPAVEGIIRVLKAARNANVKRVVMTSNFGAVGFSNKNLNTTTTEEDWTDQNEKGLSAYEKSKLLAERAAWDFIKKDAGNLEFATINPVAILGPSLSAHISGSFGLLEHLLDGSMKAIPNIPLNIVDVRDVADLHIRAMTNSNANGQRFIASADGQISLPEIAALLKNKYPKITEKVPVETLPDSVIYSNASSNKQAEATALLMRMNRNVSNTKAKKILGWKPIANNEEAIITSINSMIKFEIIK